MAAWTVCDRRVKWTRMEACMAIIAWRRFDKNYALGVVFGEERGCSLLPCEQIIVTTKNMRSLKWPTFCYCTVTAGRYRYRLVVILLVLSTALTDAYCPLSCIPWVGKYGQAAIANQPRASDNRYSLDAIILHKSRLRQWLPPPEGHFYNCGTQTCLMRRRDWNIGKSEHRNIHHLPAITKFYKPPIIKFFWIKKNGHCFIIWHCRVTLSRPFDPGTSAPLHHKLSTDYHPPIHSTMPLQPTGAVIPPPEVKCEIFQKEELFRVPITTRTYPPVMAVSGTSFWMGWKANSSQVTLTSSNYSSILATTSSPHLAKPIRVRRRPVEVIGGTLPQPEQCRGPPFFRAWTSHIYEQEDVLITYFLSCMNSSNEGAGGRQPRWTI